MLKVFPAFDYQLNYFTILRETQLSSGKPVTKGTFYFFKLSFGKAEAFSD